MLLAPHVPIVWEDTRQKTPRLFYPHLTLLMCRQDPRHGDRADEDVHGADPRGQQGHRGGYAALPHGWTLADIHHVACVNCSSLCSLCSFSVLPGSACRPIATIPGTSSAYLRKACTAVAVVDATLLMLTDAPL